MEKKNYLQSILSHFTSMDIAKLRLYLKDEYSYQETTKEIFLNEVEKVFNKFKLAGDTELLIHEGACAGKRCENCGKKGYRFVGNHSKNYLDLLYIMEGEDIKDIFSCSDFKTDTEINSLEEWQYISIDKDDEISFKKNGLYKSKVYAATSAYSEIVTNPLRQIDFEDLVNWLDNHKASNGLIGSYDWTNPGMKWTPFSILFADLSEIRTYISRNRFDIKQANSNIINIKTEQELIDCLLEHEALYESAPSKLKYCFKEEGNYYFSKRLNPIILTGEQFIQTINFLEFYQDNYVKLMEKYNTYTKAEESELWDKQDYGKESVDIFSLRFHLENRKALEEIGINIPLYINTVREI